MCYQQPLFCMTGIGLLSVGVRKKKGTLSSWSSNVGRNLAGTGVTIVAPERTFLRMCKSFLIHSIAIWPNSMTDVGKEISKTLLRTYRP